MRILQERKTYKPFEYNWAYEFFKLQNQVHWTKDKFPMTEDISDFKNKCNKDEQRVIANILKSFAITETYVGSYWSDIVAKNFKKHEIAHTAYSFSNMEAIHAESYNYLNEVLGLEDFESFLEDDVVMEKLEAMINDLAKDDKKEEFNFKSYVITKILSFFGFKKPVKNKNRDLAKSLVLFSLCTEGINLYSSFMILFSFSKNGRFQSLRRIITESNRDERLHSTFGCKLFNAMVQEDSSLFDDEMKNSIYNGVKIAVNKELKFIDHIFENRDLPSIKKEDVKIYIKHRANEKLKEVNLQPIYEISNEDYQKVEWFDIAVEGNRSDFFMGTETNYKKQVEEQW